MSHSGEGARALAKLRSEGPSPGSSRAITGASRSRPVDARLDAAEELALPDWCRDPGARPACRGWRGPALAHRLQFLVRMLYGAL